MSKRKIDGAPQPKTSAKVVNRRKPFKDSYSKVYPVISASDQGSMYAYCKPCGSHLSVAASGLWDVGQHVRGDRHKDVTEH